MRPDPFVGSRILGRIIGRKRKSGSCHLPAPLPARQTSPVPSQVRPDKRPQYSPRADGPEVQDQTNWKICVTCALEREPSPSRSPRCHRRHHRHSLSLIDNDKSHSMTGLAKKSGLRGRALYSSRSCEGRDVVWWCPGPLS
jgi:hypothetical protein